nr:putative reverse transcriptase domain-containing protein [Tanacetum cinerariifolium]
STSNSIAVGDMGDLEKDQTCDNWKSKVIQLASLAVSVRDEPYLMLKIILRRFIHELNPDDADGGGNGLTKTLLITHFRDLHFNGDAQVIIRQSLSTNLAVFEEAEVTFKRMGIWLCGGCFKTHSLRSKCRHGKGSDFVSPPDYVDDVVRFVLYDLTKPYIPSSSEQLDHVDDLVHVQHGGFTLALLDSLFSKGLRTVKSVPPKCRSEFSRVLKESLDNVICRPDDISCWVSLLVLPFCLLKTFCPRSNLECKSVIIRHRQEESIVNAIRSWSLPGRSLQLMGETLAESSPPFFDVDEEGINLGERNLKQCKRKICDGHYTAAVRVLSSSGVAPHNDATLEDLKTKHPFKPPPSLPHISIDHHHLVASPTVVLDKIKSFPHGTDSRLFHPLTFRLFKQYINILFK